MAKALAAVFTCYVLTFLAAFWMECFELALLCCILQVLSCFWLRSGTKCSAGFILCFGFGVLSTVLVVVVMLLPTFGFYIWTDWIQLDSHLFIVVYTGGTVWTLGSILFHTEAPVIKSLIEWVKSKAEDIDSDASNWQTCSDVYNSNTGAIVEGLCALLFPLIGFPLLVVHVLGALILGGPWGLRKPNKSWADGFKHMIMKVLHFAILSTVLWFWGVAIMVWISKGLLWEVFHFLSQKPRKIGFIVFYIVGVGCTVLGVYLLDQPGSQPGSELRLFSIFYTVGNVCILGSTLFLIEVLNHLKIMSKCMRALSIFVMLACLVLTVLAALLWKSLVLALTFCFLHMFSSIWYCQTYVSCRRHVVVYRLEKKHQ